MDSRVPGLLACLALLGSLGAGDLLIDVDAGQRDRVGTPIRVLLPKDPDRSFSFGTLENLETRKLVPGQWHAGELIWNLDNPIPAGKTRRYRFRTIPTPDTRRDLPPTVLGSPLAFTPVGSHFEFSGHLDAIPLRLDGRTIFAYHKAVAQPPAGIDPLYRRSGFVHPLATRSGLTVTDDFPPDHAHQHGLFFAWVETTFDGRHVDFWNQHNRTGRVGHDPDEPGPMFHGGPTQGEFAAALRHDALNTPGGPEAVLKESWTFRAYDIPGLVVLDFESRQECAGARPLTIHKYHYGGLGFRGNRAWLDPVAKGEEPPDPARSGRAEFLTGEGKHRLDGNQTRPGRWAGRRDHDRGPPGQLPVPAAGPAPPQQAVLLVRPGGPGRLRDRPGPSLHLALSPDRPRRPPRTQGDRAAPRRLRRPAGGPDRPGRGMSPTGGRHHRISTATGASQRRSGASGARAIGRSVRARSRTISFRFRPRSR